MEILPLAFQLKKLVAALVLPPLLPLLCVLAGLLLMRRRPRLGRVLAWGGLLCAWLLSTPLVVERIVAPLEDIPVLSATELQRAEAIVILGAGRHRFKPDYGGPTVNRMGLERLRYGARLARESGLPVMVSGEAGPMAEALHTDFGIEARWREGDSLDTAGNARYSVALLRSEGIQRIVLVTHAFHMRRALAEFSAAGIEALPAPTGFLSRFGGDEPDLWFRDWLPSAGAAYSAGLAAHEWLGLLVIRLRTLAS
jgi:uncharacterized SAM-binding protein YcdF (DUF218 family)